MGISDGASAAAAVNAIMLAVAVPKEVLGGTRSGDKGSQKKW